jgi:predicted MPP superfamily phosphohydrolase
MRTTTFVVFFSIVLISYGLLHWYLFHRFWMVLPDQPALRIGFACIFSVTALAFFASRFLERVSINWFTASLSWIGSFWLAALVYLLLLFVAFDLLQVVDRIVPFFPDSLRMQPLLLRRVSLLATLLLVAGTVIAGYVNARTPRTTRLELSVPRKSANAASLRIAMASDIHLGTVIHAGRLDRLVETLNTLQPDVILLVGDIVDEDLAPVISQNLGERLRRLHAPMGVYAVTGNHEYIGGADAACAYLSEHGITMLRDSVAVIPGVVSIIGREDRSAHSFGGNARKSLTELMAGADPTLPTILMDHQPFGLDEAQRAGVDLQLSGHTHHGQLWPFNFITKAIYEVSRGYLRKGHTQYYVSTGYGTWGPPIRTGNRPEVVSVVVALE